MKKMRNNCRGFTLAELTVVLGIVAIVSVLIVSFSMLVKSYTVENRETYGFYEDVDSVKLSLEKRMGELDGQNMTLSTNGNVLTAIPEDGEAQVLKFANGVLSLDGEELCRVDQISTVQFELNKDHSLLKVSFTYDSSELHESLETGFVVALRLAEVTS